MMLPDEPEQPKAPVAWEQAAAFDKWFEERTGMSAMSELGKMAREDFLAGELVWIENKQKKTKP